MSFINSVAKSMNGIKTIETSSLIFTDDNSTLNTSAGITQAQSTGQSAINKSISAVGFNTGTGDLTLTTQGTGVANLSVDLDGRYLTSIGTLDATDIPSLPASKITTDTFAIARIPALPYVSLGTSSSNNTDETIFGIKTFDEFPVKSGTGTALNPSANEQFATKYYVDNAGGGSGDAVLSAGSTSTPQAFSGVNKFSNTTEFLNIKAKSTDANVSVNINMESAGDNMFKQTSSNISGSGKNNQIYQYGGVGNNIIQGTSANGNTILQNGSNSVFQTEGRIGIGNSSPDFPLDIATTNTGATNVARTFINSANTNVNRTTNWSNDTVSINCVGDIHAGTYIAASDVRIKKDIMDLSSTLPLIEQIKPKTYKFINPKRWDRMTYGFIAQELEEVLPCVIKKSRNKIPSVMKIADVSGGVFTLQEATDFIEGDIIAIFDEDDTELRVKITELISDKQFKVETETELKDKYFIYGKFVDDFQSVEHNCLIPIMMKGIQELNAKVKELENKMGV